MPRIEFLNFPIRTGGFYCRFPVGNKITTFVLSLKSEFEAALKKGNSFKLSPFTFRSPYIWVIWVCCCLNFALLTKLFKKWSKCPKLFPHLLKLRLNFKNHQMKWNKLIANIALAHFPHLTRYLLNLLIGYRT